MSNKYKPDNREKSDIPPPPIRNEKADIPPPPIHNKTTDSHTHFIIEPSQFIENELSKRPKRANDSTNISVLREICRSKFTPDEIKNLFPDEEYPVNAKKTYYSLKFWSLERRTKEFALSNPAAWISLCAWFADKMRKSHPRAAKRVLPNIEQINNYLETSKNRPKKAKNKEQVPSLESSGYHTHLETRESMKIAQFTEHFDLHTLMATLHKNQETHEAALEAVINCGVPELEAEAYLEEIINPPADQKISFVLRRKIAKNPKAWLDACLASLIHTAKLHTAKESFDDADEIWSEITSLKGMYSDLNWNPTDEQIEFSQKPTPEIAPTNPRLSPELREFYFQEAEFAAQKETIRILMGETVQAISTNGIENIDNKALEFFKKRNPEASLLSLETWIARLCDAYKKSTFKDAWQVIVPIAIEYPKTFFDIYTFTAESVWFNPDVKEIVKKKMRPHIRTLNSEFRNAHFRPYLNDIKRAQ